MAVHFQSKNVSVTDVVDKGKQLVFSTTERSSFLEVSNQSTVKKSHVFIPGSKSEPPYRILTLEAETTTSGEVVGKSNTGLIIGVTVGVFLGVALLIAAILLVIFIKRRKNRKFKEEIFHVENPRYQQSGLSRGVGSSDRGRNNNKNGDIEILATRVSSRKKRRAPPPPANPFGDAEFTDHRQASQDELSPPPVELSTFSTGKPEKDEEKPLLEKKNGAAPERGRLESDASSEEDIEESFKRGKEIKEQEERKKNKD